MATNWHPTWWNDSNHSAWDRIKEAIQRDWEQTRHDLKLSGGHELNQGASDTIKQAMGKEPIPAGDRPNPPKVIGSWAEAEMPVGYGYGARQKYGADHPVWNEGIELRLRSEWDATPHASTLPWRDVRLLVRHGYEFKGSH